MARSVLITGGAHRLGSMLCRCFAKAGWDVWCHYQRSSSAAELLRYELEQQGFSIRTIQADLADDAQRRQMMNHIMVQSGPLYCLVNNASSFEPDSARDFDIDAARQQLEVNLLAPMALSALMAQGIPCSDTSGGRSIIHVLDQKVFNLNPDYFSYTTSKLALERLVALQAQALSPQLRVCGVAPGLMFLSGPQTQQNFDKASRINLMRRPTSPAQVAASCLFLADNQCITGVTLTVDNGQHLVPLPRDVMFMVQDLLKDSQ
ncbi:SDR family NAD(P)-dependent oxidoreductase [Rhodoferax antarcticus]|uniref:Putative 3-oxoacyl-[acyl-carrier protein] reductase n=1 Tax=Rhodoferax antarcticus ANT.BR TaxID=1111071 RepID=A0A1Q8YG87_9BURK|nr:SDR family NAD(P)-dependent oxidoreductase [Rhodoferax antarcticus]APW45579.1 short-chain dehydrogenase [Rhodoferax antarcticus]OLP07064.1 putative 3-oxoacyl-[acyl-carrier protein] reductase [Rhodoferax antarcticus ANT.BR]